MEGGGLGLWVGTACKPGASAGGLGTGGCVNQAVRGGEGSCKPGGSDLDWGACRWGGTPRERLWGQRTLPRGWRCWASIPGEACVPLRDLMLAPGGPQVRSKFRLLALPHKQDGKSKSGYAHCPSLPGSLPGSVGSESSRIFRDGKREVCAQIGRWSPPAGLICRGRGNQDGVMRKGPHLPHVPGLKWAGTERPRQPPLQPGSVPGTLLNSTAIAAEGSQLRPSSPPRCLTGLQFFRQGQGTRRSLPLFVALG